MTETVTEEYEPHGLSQQMEHDTAIPVRIVREPGQHSSAPEFSSVQSYVLAGTEQPFPILAFSKKRSKATITVQPNQALLGVNTFNPLPSGSTNVTANGQVGNVWDTSPLGDDLTGIAFDINIFAVSGVTPTVQFQLQTSADQNVWATLATSSAVTTVSTVRVATTAPLDRYVRLVATAIGGTTPSFSVTVNGTASTGLPVSSPTQSVRFAKQEQVSNNQGAIVQAPGSLSYSAQPGLWCLPQSANGAVIVTVVEEWYA